MEAAHIVPVAEDGPDIVQNGIALSRTAHWLFDRHLISLDADYGLLIAAEVPQDLQRSMAAQRTRIHLPYERTHWPHPTYVARHRAKFLEKNRLGFDV